MSLHGGVFGCAYIVASSAGFDGAADISVDGGVCGASSCTAQSSPLGVSGAWSIAASPGGVDGAADIADGGKVPTRPEAEEAAAVFEVAERLPSLPW